MNALIQWKKMPHRPLQTHRHIHASFIELISLSRLQTANDAKTVHTRSITHKKKRIGRNDRVSLVRGAFYTRMRFNFIRANHRPTHVSCIFFAIRFVDLQLTIDVCSFSHHHHHLLLHVFCFNVCN